MAHSDGHTDIIIFSLPCYCLQVSTWETFTKNPLRENQHKSPGFWLQQYRYLEWYLNVYTWVKSNQECIWTLDRIPRPGIHYHYHTLVTCPQCLQCHICIVSTYPILHLLKLVNFQNPKVNRTRTISMLSNGNVDFSCKAILKLAVAVRS